MRSWTPFTMFVLAWLGGCGGSQPADMTPELWREDLAALGKGLIERHAAPYARMRPEEFVQAVAALDARIPRLSDEAIQVELGRLVAMLHDGHTELWLAREGLGFRNYPLFLYDFAGEIRVAIAARSHEELLGAVVEAIDGVPIARVKAAVDPLIARDNEVEPLLSIPAYIAIPEILYGLGLVATPDSATFTLSLDGRRFERVLPALDEEAAQAAEWVRASDASEPALWAKHRGRNYWYEWLEDSGTLYVKYDRCADQDGQPSLKQFAREMFAAFDAHAVQRLVFDLRNNRGGNYHKSEPLIEGVVRRADRLGDGRLFVITGRETFSAGMVTSLQLRQRAGAILAGEPGRSRPNGCDNFEWFHLPHSRLRVDYTEKVVERAPELAGSDVLPVDLPVVNGFEDHRKGVDRVLEAVLAYPLPEASGPD